MLLSRVLLPRLSSPEAGVHSASLPGKSFGQQRSTSRAAGSKPLLVAAFLGSLFAVAPAAAAAANPSLDRADSAGSRAFAARGAHAEALLQQGRALLASGRVEAACENLESSEALAHELGTLLELGDCYEQAGRTASAWHAFLEAEAVAGTQKDLEREQRAQERVAALEPKLTRVLFVVPLTSRIPGLTVKLGENTIPASAWGTTIAVDPGVQRVRAIAKGYHPWGLELGVSGAPGKQYRVEVPTLNPAQALSDSRHNAYRTAGVVTGSFGLAGIGAGAVFSALSHNGNDAGECAKSGTVQCVPSKASERTAFANAATVSYAIGGALFATGVTLFVLAPAPDHQEKHALRLAARVANSGGRVQLEGVW